MKQIQEFTFNQLKAIIPATLKQGNVPLLLGEAGIGKSSFIEDIATLMKAKVFTMPINQMADRADITGARILKDETTGRYKQAFFPHKIIDDAIEYAENNPKQDVILFLDEINRASADITSTVLAFITTRVCGTAHFPENIRFVTAGNDKGNIIALDNASLSRFVIFHVKPDLSTFFEVNPDLNPFIKNTLIKYPKDLTASQVEILNEEDVEDTEEKDETSLDDILNLDDSTFTQITVPRTITYLSNFLNAMGFDKSGTTEELDNIKSLILEEIEDSSNTLLNGVITAYTGVTSFTTHLYEEIINYFQSISTKTLSSSAQNIPLIKARINQDIINKIHYATNSTDVDVAISEIPDENIGSNFIWLISKHGKIEINNNNAYETAVTSLANKIDTLHPDDVSLFTQSMTQDSSIFDKKAIEIITNTKTQAMSNLVQLNSILSEE